GQYGSAGKGSCLGYAIAEGRLLDLVIGAIERLLASPKNVDAVVREAERLAQAAEKQAPEEAKRLQGRRAAPDKRSSGGTAKPDTIDPRLSADLEASIIQWKAERGEVVKAIEKAQEAADARQRLSGIKQKVLAVMKDVRKALRSGDLVLVRAVLR